MSEVEENEEDYISLPHLPDDWKPVNLTDQEQEYIDKRYSEYEPVEMQLKY